MQPNLGSLVHLSEGPIERCYEGRDKILYPPWEVFVTFYTLNPKPLTLNPKPRRIFTISLLFRF